VNSEFFYLEGSFTYREMSYGGPTVFLMSDVQSLAETSAIICFWNIIFGNIDSPLCQGE